MRSPKKYAKEILGVSLRSLNGVLGLLHERFMISLLYTSLLQQFSMCRNKKNHFAKMIALHYVIILAPSPLKNRY